LVILTKVISEEQSRQKPDCSGLESEWGMQKKMMGTDKNLSSKEDSEGGEISQDGEGNGKFLS
jgi:hypothetical protein